MPGSTHRAPLRFLVIGCGSIGRRHIGSLVGLNAGEILAFDVRDYRRGEIEAHFGTKVLDSLEDAWGRRPDVALMAVPTHLHVPMALQTAEQGYHLFIEKPLSNRLDGVNRLVDVVRRRRLVTLIGCNMRFHPGPVRLKQRSPPAFRPDHTYPSGDQIQIIGKSIASSPSKGEVPSWIVPMKLT